MDYQEFKDLVAQFAVEGNIPEDVREEFYRMIQEDERCSKYFGSHLLVQRYIRSERGKHSIDRDRIFELAESAVKMIESGTPHGDIPKKNLDALVYILGDKAKLARREKDHDEAISLLHNVLIYRPDDHMALSMLGHVYSDIKEYKEALNYYTLALDSKLLKSHLRPMVLSHLGLTHARLGDTKKAEKILLEARELGPEDPTVLNNIGVFYLDGSRYHEALEVMKKAEPMVEEHFGTSEETAKFYGNLAMVYFELGDKENALRYIRAALALDPESDKLLHNEGIISGASEGTLLLLI